MTMSTASPPTAASASTTVAPSFAKPSYVLSNVTPWLANRRAGNGSSSSSSVAVVGARQEFHPSLKESALFFGERSET